MTKLRTILRNERGMSILELLIASFLTVLLVSAALEFYLTSHKTWITQTDVAEIQQNARVCLDEMAGVMRMAGYGLPAGHPAFVVGSDSLTVYYQRNGSVDTTLYYVYKPDSVAAYLMRQEDSGFPAVFSDGVEGITVTPVSPRIFELTLTARNDRPDQQTLPGDGYRRRTLTTEVMVRNLSI
jgi:Tfp pilus assembly protein PilW